MVSMEEGKLEGVGSLRVLRERAVVVVEVPRRLVTDHLRVHRGEMVTRVQ